MVEANDNVQPLLSPSSLSNVSIDAAKNLENAKEWIGEDGIWMDIFPMGIRSSISEEHDKVIKILETLSLKEHEKNRYLAQSVVAGPAIKLAVAANAYSWTAFILFPLIAYPICHCDAHGGLASYPLWLMLLMVLASSLPLSLEIACLHYVLPVQVFVLKHRGTGPKFMGIEITRNTFMIINMALSFVGHVDFVTNGLFLAKAWKTNHSACTDAVDAVSDAIFANASWPFSALGLLTFPQAVLLAWSMMMLQPLLALVHCIPWKLLNGKEIKSDAFEIIQPSHKMEVEFATPAGFYTYREDALSALAESGRMASLNFLSWDCMSANVLQEEEGDGGLKSGYFAGDVYMKMRRIVLRFVIYTLLETVVFMQMQATALGLDKCVDLEHKVDWQLVFSLACTFLSTGLLFVQTTITVWRMYGKIGESRTRTGNQVTATEFNDEKKHKERHLVFGVFVAFASVFIVVLLYAMVKVYMNSMYCDCGWNFALPWDFGCVQYTDVFHQRVV